MSILELKLDNFERILGNMRYNQRCFIVNSILLHSHIDRQYVVYTQFGVSAKFCSIIQPFNVDFD